VIGSETGLRGLVGERLEHMIEEVRWSKVEVKRARGGLEVKT
jgi:hypothetical protein